MTGGDDASACSGSSAVDEKRDSLPGHAGARDVKVVKCLLTKRLMSRSCRRRGLPVICRAVRCGPPSAVRYSDDPRASLHLVFVNNRRAAGSPRGINGLAGEEIARSHHGSVSKEARLEVESCSRRAASLPGGNIVSGVGIDIGAIDLVVQIEAPTTIAQVVQRIGRSGHRLDAVKGRDNDKDEETCSECTFRRPRWRSYIEEVWPLRLLWTSWPAGSRLHCG